MENLVKKFPGKLALGLILVLSVLSVVVIVVNRNTLNPTGAGSRVLLAQLDHELPTDNVMAIANGILAPDSVYKESTSKFHLSFQNKSDAELQAFKDSFKLAEPGVVLIDDFNVISASELFVNERVAGISAFGLILFLGYIIMTMKKFDFTRGDVAKLALTEVLVILFGFSTLLALASILSASGFAHSPYFWTIFLIAFGVLLASRIYSVFRMLDIAKKQADGSLKSIYTGLFKKYWPEFVFVLVLAFVLTVLPWTVLGSQALLISALTVWAILISFFIFALLQDHLLKLFTDWKFSAAKNSKGSKSFWSKKW